MAAKLEEIYPPHIKSFAESTNDSVTDEDIVKQELEICQVLGWNFEFQTHVEWATWFMKRWDTYVLTSTTPSARGESYLKHQFSLKFYENG